MGQDRSRRSINTRIKKDTEVWQSLVHVCRRWRNIVFGSPLRLNLILVCTTKTPAGDTLDVWPPLPLVIWSHGYYGTDGDLTKGVDNVVAALRYSDRVCRISLAHAPKLYLEELFEAAQEPFPELTDLELSSDGGPVVPDSFLGASAPRLQLISLSDTPFPGLSKLLLSATHLVNLHLREIPHSGYISPEVMATTLSTLTCLEFLSLEFKSPQSYPDQESRRPPPPTRSVLPVLEHFTFKGASDYLEYLVTRVDAPQLRWMYMIFFNQIVFYTPQLTQFVNRIPTLKALKTGYVTFGWNAARVKLTSVSSLSQTLIYLHGALHVKVPCIELDWQVSSLEQVFTSSLPPLSALEVLYIHMDPSSYPDWQDNIDNALWLELLRPFPAVKNLYLDAEFAPRIMPSLKELVGGRTTEVLPTLQNIFVEGLQSSGPVQESIRQFVAARQVTGHPIAVFLWENSEKDKFWGE